MRYRPLSRQHYEQTRKKLAERLKPSSALIIHANDVLPTTTNADGTMPYRQNANLFYLTGVEQEESVLLLAPNFPDESMREILFLRKTNAHLAIWEGHKLTQAEAQSRTGIRTVKWVEEFEKTLQMVLAETEHIYLDTNEHIRKDSHTITSNDRFIQWCKQRYPMHQYHRLAPIIYDLRTVKSGEEIAQMQRACDLTEQGFRRILEEVKEGIWEYELEASYLHEFVANGSKGFAYTPIIASGANACVLHYIDNDQPLQNGDLLLMDVGAEYGNYNADMTRTIPVGGRYNQRQRSIYDAVLRVKNEATQLLTPGNSIPEYHQAVGEMMTKELLDLGLLDPSDIKNQDPDWPAYKKYFMHGTSHHLGLDVHDVASIYTTFKPGMVFTVEPGIYVLEEGIGIRLEDDIVITENGHRNLMEHIPIEAEEIEEIMQNHE